MRVIPDMSEFLWIACGIFDCLIDLPATLMVTSSAEVVKRCKEARQPSLRVRLLSQRSFRLIVVAIVGKRIERHLKYCGRYTMKVLHDANHPIRRCADAIYTLAP